jgi:hypothetical protein
MTYIFDLVLAMTLLFFLFLPITDRRTVVMKLGIILGVVILFAVTLAVPDHAGPSVRSAQALLTGQ